MRSPVPDTERIERQPLTAAPRVGQEERRPNPLWQLFLMRLRSMFRQKSIAFWVFVFPLITSAVLGLAFRNRGVEQVHAAVVEGDGASELSARLGQVEGLTAAVLPRALAEEQLRRGELALVVVPGDPPELLSDPTNGEARTARWMVRDAIERMRGRQDVGTFVERAVTTPGRRYVDFLIPGLLGFGLMSSGMWGLGWAIVQMRVGKLLKRLAATPMRRSDFLLSFVLSRTVFALVEIAFFVGFARLLFDLRVAGSTPLLLGFGLLGALSFSGVALFVASRAENVETANGLINLVTMPMMVLSGVFFSSTRFPQVMQPFVRLLPLTALNEGMRAVMLDGKGLGALGFQTLVLALWGGVGFVLALKLFRWT
jgi:ABC-type multidrug transport system permease subunit